VAGDPEVEMKVAGGSELTRALDYLRSRDPVLAAVIDRVGPFALQPDPDIFKSLVRAIIAQQISTSAARSIYKKLIALAGGEDRLLKALATLSVEELRTAGISAQKARYLRDLAEKVSTGAVKIEAIASRKNDEIIAELTQVTGIGVWTVQMLLIFSLGRLDVFPGDDLGIRTAIKKLYRKRILPKKTAQLRKFEKLWQPYASVASWYCWRSLEFD
jgi:DNA-3-methyladenine glycosylase II